MGWTPRRRKPIVVRDIGDEILAYDLSTHRASCLNRGAAEVFRACDGLRSSAEIAALVGERLDCRVGTRYVDVALERLVRSGLVESPPALQPGRREALRRLAATAALALPAVTTVLAPEPAQAQTCLPNGSNCLMSGDCCSGCCMSNNQMCSGGTVLCLP